MKKVILTIGLACGLALSAAAGNFYSYDQNGNYSWGRIDNNGNFYRYNQNGDYTSGRVSPNGNYYQYNQNGAYSWGRISPN
jgi:glucan-binding YG repeat protein